MNTITPYLFFGGRCAEAIEFYRSELGAEVETIIRYDESPAPVPANFLPEGFETKVMHSSLLIRGARILAGDGISDQIRFGGFRLALHLTSDQEAHEVFNALAKNGEVMMPLCETPWSPCYGLLTDQFNVGWMIMVNPATSEQTEGGRS